MAYIKKYNTGGPTTKPTFGKVYVNGVDVTKNNKDAVDAIMSAFNDRKYVQDYLMSGNDVHITQNLDGSISFSGIPLDSSLKRRKQDREKDEVAKILFGVARNQNPREPGKKISRAGDDIYIEYSWTDKGIPDKEVGLLLPGDDSFAALNRLENLYDFYKNIDSYDEIEGFASLGNDKSSVKKYLEKYIINEDKTGIKEELLNALSDNANYNLFKGYKDVFDSIGIKYKDREPTEEEISAKQKYEADLRDSELRGKSGVSSGIGIVDPETELVSFDPRDEIWSILESGKNYHLNTDFVKYARSKGYNGKILDLITDDEDNSFFLINGHLYKTPTLFDLKSKVNANDRAIFNSYIESNKLKPYLDNDIISYYLNKNPYVDLSDQSRLYPGMTYLYNTGGYGTKNGMRITSAAMFDPRFNYGSKIIFRGYNPNSELTYDKYGRPIFDEGFIVDYNNPLYYLEQGRRKGNESVWEPVYNSRKDDGYKGVTYGFNVVYLKIGENQYIPVIKRGDYYTLLNNRAVKEYNGDWFYGDPFEDGSYHFNTDKPFPATLVETADPRYIIWRKSGGKIQKAKGGLRFTHLDPLSPDNPMNPLNGNNTGLNSVQLTPQLKPEQQFSLKPKVDLVGDYLSAAIERGRKSGTASAQEQKTGSDDIPGLEPLKPNWATPILRSAQLISQLAGSKAAEKSMAKAIRESYTPKEQVQYNTPRFNTASYDQFANANKKALLDAQANTPLTSDPTKNMSYQQIWTQQRAAQIGKENAFFSDISDKYKTDDWRIENKNRESAIITNNESNKASATMRSALHQNAAQGKLQRTGMWGQFFAGMQSEAETARLYKENSWKLRQYDIITNKYEGQLSTITSQIDQGYEAFKKKNPTTTLTKEEWLSQHNPDLKAKRDDLTYGYRDMLSRIKYMTYNPYLGNYSMYDPSYRYYVPQTQFGEDDVSSRKKGGKLSFIEKVSLEDKKSSNRNELERAKAMIKSMERGNERLFKLILKILE